MTILQVSNVRCSDPALISALLAGECFWPSEDRCLQANGLGDPFLDSLVCKTLLIDGNVSGRGIATKCCLPFTTIKSVMERLRSQLLIAHVGTGRLNDYIYTLTEEGRVQARAYHRECAYSGPAPVPLADYISSVEAQAICDEAVRRDDLLEAFRDISVSRELLDILGPAVNSGSGMFLYGSPGNGKSTLANRITSCFGQDMWLPYAIIDDRNVIKLFDPAYHEITTDPQDLPSHDRRWARIRRPTVIVGGEMTMNNLEITYDRATNVSEAPLQMKSNCGCLLIDDFGRQRMPPEDLLNRWIIPLENRQDYLTLGSGKKIQVPFEQLIIFSTNLDPCELVDEAFLRRIPYRIELPDPDEHEFQCLFQLASEQAGCVYDPDAVEHLLERHYRPRNHPLRRCQPRDLLMQIRHYCVYNDLSFEMLAEYFDCIADGFFTKVRMKQLSGAPHHDSKTGH
jgi:hypothetical protein